RIKGWAKKSISAAMTIARRIQDTSVGCGVRAPFGTLVVLCVSARFEAFWRVGIATFSLHSIQPRVPRLFVRRGRASQPVELRSQAGQSLQARVDGAAGRAYSARPADRPDRAMLILFQIVPLPGPYRCLSPVRLDDSS